MQKIEIKTSSGRENCAYRDLLDAVVDNDALQKI